MCFGLCDDPHIPGDHPLYVFGKAWHQLGRKAKSSHSCRKIVSIHWHQAHSPPKEYAREMEIANARASHAVLQLEQFFAHAIG
jgi:hypothetical protein